jgi:hypothetical protein
MAEHTAADPHYPQPADGWVGFNGGGCPVSEDAVVEVFTKRECDIGWSSWPKRAGDWDWSIEDVPGDIMAYRLVEAAAP